MDMKSVLSEMISWLASEGPSNIAVIDAWYPTLKAVMAEAGVSDGREAELAIEHDGHIVVLVVASDYDTTLCVEGGFHESDDGPVFTASLRDKP